MGIKRFQFGNKIITNSVVIDYNYSSLSELNNYFKYSNVNGNITLERILDKNDAIFGLGENVKGINKRGSFFTSFNTDDPDINENRTSLYASHNFFIVSGTLKTFGVFIDSPKIIHYDLGFYDLDKLVINTLDGFDLYIIESNDVYPELHIISRFREMIGKSYIAPLFGFGVGQSRWGYKTKEDLENILKGFSDKKIPLDMLFFDIDCLEEFEDFTFNQTFYKDKGIDKEFFNDLIDKGIHLIPIVDAAVKVKDGYFLYDELMKEKGYIFDKEGKPYIVGVWPGDSILPDYLSKAGSLVFAKGYKKYLELGIDGFWNDMNEPALFYGKDKLNELAQYLKQIDYDNFTVKEFNDVKYHSIRLKNYIEDYKGMYHKYDLAYSNDNIINHYDVPC